MTNDQRVNKILYVILCDSRSLMNRIAGKKDEYISIFAQTRSREHFEIIFRSKFDQMNPDFLSYCPEETVELLFRFHDCIDKLKWYLVYTGDMPNAIDESITHDIHAIQSVYNDLSNFIETKLFNDIDESSDSGDEVPPTPVAN